jgi:hypothetical protein
MKIDIRLVKIGMLFADNYLLNQEVVRTLILNP